MGKSKISYSLAVSFGIVATIALTMLLIVHNDLQEYSKAAALSVNETEKGLEEFERLIEVEALDYSYYQDVATGFLYSFNYHLVTSSRFAAKYNDYYWDTYSPAKDAMRDAIAEFIEVEDQEAYEEALEKFYIEKKRYGVVVDHFEAVELK